MENLYKKLDDVILCIKESNEYKNVIDIKKKMDSNEELKKKINDIKLLQKKYVKSNYDSSVKKDLDKLNDELLEVPIYRIYLDNSNPLFKDKNDCDYHLYCDAVVVCSSHTIPTK